MDTANVEVWIDGVWVSVAVAAAPEPIRDAVAGKMETSLWGMQLADGSHWRIVWR